MASSIPSLAPGAIRKRNVFDVIETLNTRAADNHDDDGRLPTILVRVDFNVPMNADTGVITDASRIRGALPTIQAILAAQMNVVLVSHMGRPKLVQKQKDDDATRQQRKELSLQPVADYLSQKLLDGTPVLFGPDCTKAASTIAELHAQSAATGRASICLLENLRFTAQEEANDPALSQTLAAYADAYINDAFGTSHRAHASVAGVPALLDPALCGIGCLVASELAYLDFSSSGSGNSGSEEHKSVVAAIIGGSKVSTKLPVIQGLLQAVDILVLGGGLAFTFLKAQGIPVGNSLVEDGMIDTAKDLIAQAARDGKQLVIPADAVCSQSFPSGPMKMEDTRTFNLTTSEGIPDGWMGLDCGPKSIANNATALAKVTKIVMNGPMGVFEVPPFDMGTRGLVDTLQTLTEQNGTITVVGGGDSVAALEAFGKMDAVSYVSTGGGATLELLAGDILPGVAAIADYAE